jgi:glycine/D-amino acid oxidase-like deaminating enzyme
VSADTCTSVVIGSGESGKYLAWHLASSGEKTVVVERRWIGGSCATSLPSLKERDTQRQGGSFGQSCVGLRCK